MYETTCGGSSVELDEIDYQLLNEIAVNARTSLVDLAEILACSSQMVNYRMKNLIKNGVIKAFRVNVNLTTLGFQLFKVDIYLKEHRQRVAILNYLKNTPNLECLNVSVGWSDLEPEIIVKDMSELSQIMGEINSRFPNAIRKQTFWITEKVHKERWLPLM